MVERKSKSNYEHDYLEFQNNTVIREKLALNEQILFTIETQKMNRFNLYNDRILLLTNHRLINIEKKYIKTTETGYIFKRIVTIEQIEAITKSNE